MIELRGLTKEYPGAEQPAVDGLDLVIETGETVALLGPSGCGKTSTLNMIVGLERPTAGDILVDGRSIVDTPVEKRGIGLVFQDYAVFTSMTVRGNLAFGLEIRKLPKSEIESRVGRMAEFLGLEDQLGVKAGRLGGSELQRVAIGRTLVTDPKILLLDEPLSNLEPEARLAMRQELRRLRSELGLTIVYVTHDQVEALSLADRLAIMAFGRLLEAGPTEAVLERPGLIEVAAFLGSPPMNVIGGFFHELPGGPVFRHDGADLALPMAALPALAKSGRYYHLGVRPEDLRLDEGPEPFHRGVVSAIEPRGFDCVATISGKGLALKALTGPGRLDWGRPAAVATTADKLFLFDNRGRLMAAGLEE
jgi:multiple sugar transport system ATP-binding protein